jgi:hypothetical protein
MAILLLDRLAVVSDLQLVAHPSGLTLVKLSKKTSPMTPKLIKNDNLPK